MVASKKIIWRKKIDERAAEKWTCYAGFWNDPHCCCYAIKLMKVMLKKKLLLLAALTKENFGD